eukprot:436836-Hanusia_phi.AAC.2
MYLGEGEFVWRGGKRCFLPLAVIPIGKQGGSPGHIVINIVVDIFENGSYSLFDGVSPCIFGGLGGAIVLDDDPPVVFPFFIRSFVIGQLFDMMMIDFCVPAASELFVEN